MSQKLSFMVRYGSLKMLKDMISSGAFDGSYMTAPGSKDQNHKLVLDKLRITNDPEYAHYRDKRLDSRIEKAETLPKDHKDRTNTAYHIAMDRHASMDHLKWATMNGTINTITQAFENRNTNKAKLANYLFTHTMNHPLGRQIRGHIRRIIPESDLHRQIDKFEQTLPPEQRSKINQ